jgi:hypothetical protein
MSFEAESNLSVFEAETSDELSFEELESVAGGTVWDDIGDTCKKWLRTDKGPNVLRHMGNTGRVIGNIIHNLPEK